MHLKKLISSFLKKLLKLLKSQMHRRKFHYSKHEKKRKQNYRDKHRAVLTSYDQAVMQVHPSWLNKEFGTICMTNYYPGKKFITQENISSSDGLEAGLMGLLLLAVQRCSIGAGAGISSFSISCFSSSMYSRSFMLGLASFPAGKHVSDTHCWPPQSKPNISSLHPTLYPSDFRQNSASA